MGKRKKSAGHYCWACGRQRPNEKFSGGGHARHICRECAKLGSDELAYRQGLRHLERCVTWDGFIRRRQRATFDRLLQHADPRIREAAVEIQRADAYNREFARTELDPAAGPTYLDEEYDDDCPF